MTDPVVIEDATIRPHRVEWVGDTEYPCHVWYLPHQRQPNLYTAAEGEAMGLTPPPPTIDPLVTFDPNYDYPRGTVIEDCTGRDAVRGRNHWYGAASGLDPQYRPYTIVHVPAATQPPSTADALHTLGLTDEDIKAAAASYGHEPWMKKVTRAAREAVQR